MTIYAYERVAGGKTNGEGVRTTTVVYCMYAHGADAP